MDRWMWVVLVVLGVAAVVVLPRLFGGGAGPEVVRAKIAAGAMVIDVRTPGEFASGAYPGAVNIPVDVLGQQLAKVPKGKPVVVYCRSGARSAAAEKTLRAAGYADVTNGGGLSGMPR